MTQFHTTAQGRHLAYDHVAGHGPTVVFLGGFRSDMTGTKAAHLADWARGQGRDFLRFDYSGHGQSSGKFEEGCISDWVADAMDIITARAKTPFTLVGSSMGGWIALLLARRMPQNISQLVTIAAAPDFTEDLIWAGFSDAQKTDLVTKGAVQIPSDYDAPYAITQHLIEDGRKNLIFDAPLNLPFPTHFLQGTADTDVPVSHALRLFDHATGPELRLTLAKDADHRFSSPSCLKLITAQLDEGA